MVNARITLAGVWVALMLTYLLGDVMRIFAGDFTAERWAADRRPHGCGWARLR